MTSGRKLNALDLFSGIGGNSLGLSEWINTLAYCEQDPYAQAVLLSRMSEGLLPSRPIWNDVQTLRGDMLPPVEIIVAGFPCQDISVAGHGEGLEGKRSGLYWQIHRLAQETRSPLLFLENVPAIRTRGLDTIIRSLSELGYDCRWTFVSAAEVGAHHLRERWFLLAAHSDRLELREQSGGSSGQNGQEALQPGIHGQAQPLADSSRGRCSESHEGQVEQPGRAETVSRRQALANGSSFRRSQGRTQSEVRRRRRTDSSRSRPEVAHTEESRLESQWQGLPTHVRQWEPEPHVDRVVNGLPYRVDRIKCLGNAVVPAQAKEAFRRLMGL